MAIDFDGATDRIDYADSSDWIADGAQSFYLRIVPHDIGGAQAAQYFVNKGEADQTAGIVIDTQASDSGKLRLLVIGGTNLIKVTDTVLTDETESIIVITWDGTVNHTGIHIYVDGVIEESYTAGTGGVSLTTAPGNLSLGGRGSADDRNADMTGHGFARWNKVLSAGEIAVLMDKYSPDYISNGLTHNAPLIRNADMTYGGYEATLDGTSVLPHLDTLYPSEMATIHVPAAVSSVWPFPGLLWSGDL